MRTYAWPGNREAARRVAVILPGAGYTAQAPLLYWSAELLVERGWHVQAVEWQITAEVRERSAAFAVEAVERAFADAPPADHRLVLAKSFGTFALPWALANDVPGVWLTPVLVDAGIRTALAQAGDRHLAVGGDRDIAWHPVDEVVTKARLVTVPGADHGLEVGDWRSSVEAHVGVLEHVTRHLQSI